MDDLCLNIVVEPAASLDRNNNNSQKKKKKNNNKYERRRRRAQQVRDATSATASSAITLLPQQQPYDGQHLPEANAKGNINDSNQNAEQTTTRERKSNVKAAPAPRVVVPPDSIKDSTANDKDQDMTFEHSESAAPAPDSSLLVSNHSNHNQEVVKNSSRASFLTDPVARATYLREFHARPLELDRRAGASRKPLLSKTSTHIFAPHEYDNWHSMPLHERIRSTITSPRGFGLTRPTLVQARVMAAFDGPSSPHQNLLIQSETGSGKTLAYVLPIIQSLAVDATSGLARPCTNRASTGTRCIILCPTRELAMQTAAVVTRLVTTTSNWLVVGCLVGGDQPRASEKARIRKGLAVIVATPGRLLDHLTRTTALITCVQNNQLQFLVLDEVDRLLDLGLGVQVKEIVQRLRAAKASPSPKSGGTSSSGTSRSSGGWRSVLVSATVPVAVERLAQEIVSGTNEPWMRIQGNHNNNAVVVPSPSSSPPPNQHQVHSDQTDNHQRVNDDKSTISYNHHDDNDNDDPAAGVVHTTTTTGAAATLELADATPRQLVHYHLTVTAKLRLAALMAFLVQRAQSGERTVVFMATCASVDFHYALFQAVHCILPANNHHNHRSNNTTLTSTTTSSRTNKNVPPNDQPGIFGRSCPVYKLHGNVPHAERQHVLRRFAQGSDDDNNSNSNNNNNNGPSQQPSRGGAILLATDVAARGLNLPGVHWTVSYDPPSDVADVCHRAGRVCRAGASGCSLLFLLPSERLYLNVLKQRGVPAMHPLSLAAILNTAAEICPELTQDGVRRSGGGGGGFRSSSSSGAAAAAAASTTQRSTNPHRAGEAFGVGIQHCLEECLAQDNIKAKAEQRKATASTRKRTSDKPVEAVGELLDLARTAFLAHIRAYPTREASVRHLFCAKSLHLGHMARSFCLLEPPKQLVNHHNKKRKRGMEMSTRDGHAPSHHHEAMAFDVAKRHKDGSKHARSGLGGGARGKPNSGGHDDSAKSMSITQRKKRLLLANASKIQRHGMDSF